MTKVFNTFIVFVLATFSVGTLANSEGEGNVWGPRMCKLSWRKWTLK
jgi:hypothetical protein